MAPTHFLRLIIIGCVFGIILLAIPSVWYNCCCCRKKSRIDQEQNDQEQIDKMEKSQNHNLYATQFYNTIQLHFQMTNSSKYMYYSSPLKSTCTNQSFLGLSETPHSELQLAHGAAEHGWRRQEPTKVHMSAEIRQAAPLSTPPPYVLRQPKLCPSDVSFLQSWICPSRSNGS